MNKTYFLLNNIQKLSLTYTGQQLLYFENYMHFSENPGIIFHALIVWESYKATL